MIRVLLVDDQALIRSGLRSILDRCEDLEVVGEAADGEGAVRATRRLGPDVVLMDIRMPGTDGLAATRAIARSGEGCPKVLILTTFEIDEYIQDGLSAGASGFILKDSEPAAIVAAVRAAHAGDAVLAPSVTRRLISSYVERSGRDVALPETLTEREHEVLQAMARGLSNAEIAGELYLAEATVKTHVTAVLAKLGVRDRLQAVVAAYRAGAVR